MKQTIGSTSRDIQGPEVQSDKPPEQVVVTPDGRTALVAADRWVFAFDLRSGYVPWRVDNAKRGTLFAISPDGTTFVRSSTMNSGALIFSDLKSEFAAIGELELGVGRAVFSPDGRLLVTLGREQRRGQDRNEVAVWDVPARKLLRKLEVGNFIVSDAAFTPDGRTLALAGTGDKGGQVQLWDVPEGPAGKETPVPPPAEAPIPPMPVADRDVIQVAVRQFAIPFLVPANGHDLKEVQLYASTDQGKTWELTAVATPDQGRFQVTVPRDGLYWYSVRALKNDGSAVPADVATLVPQLKVQVKEAIDPARPAPPRDRQQEIEAIRQQIRALEERLKALGAGT
jgi:WD40 repeat protein